MKLCLRCRSPFEGDWECPSCHWIPEKTGEFPAFAPSLAQSSQGFKACYFAELAELEEKNFWFRARNKLILWAVQKSFPQASNFLEVGCGTGYVSQAIGRAFSSMRLSGSEIYGTGLALAAKRIKNADLFQMDAKEIPFVDEFDMIGAFDVLEHIEEDKTVMRQIHQALKAGGVFVLTVPQHPFLWSQQDEAACHVRRYRKKDIEGKLRKAGFSIENSTSFVSLLLPLMLLSRLRPRVAPDQYDTMSELKLGPLANKLFGSIMSIEYILIRMNVRFPAGGSRLIVARK